MGSGAADRPVVASAAADRRPAGAGRGAVASDT